MWERQCNKRLQSDKKPPQEIMAVNLKGCAARCFGGVAQSFAVLNMSQQLEFDDLEEIEMVCSCGAHFFMMLSEKDMFCGFLEDTEYLCPKCEHREQVAEPDQNSGQGN
jgi:hypothetical protein